MNESTAIGMAVLTNMQIGAKKLLQAFSDNKHELRDTMHEVSKLLAQESNTKSETPARSVHLIGVGFSQVVAEMAKEILLRAYVKADMVIPGNLSHGTITQLQKGDIAILISKTGETAETLAACDMVKNAGCICIGVTEKADSSLVRSCDKVLILPEVAEAIPGSRMPTVSAMNMEQMFMTIGGMITGLNGNNYHTDGAHPGGTAKSPAFALPKSALQD